MSEIQNEPKINLYKSLLAAQKSCSTVIKDRRGYNYKYADLAAVLEVALPALNSNGIVLMFSGVKIDKIDLMFIASIDVKLIHADSGEQEVTTFSCPVEGLTAQKVGSANTYAKRYALCSIFAISVDEDDDGAAASGISNNNPYARVQPSVAFKNRKEAVQSMLKYISAHNIKYPARLCTPKDKSTLEAMSEAEWQVEKDRVSNETAAAD